MDSTHVVVSGEEITIKVDNGKVACDGYDLENEKLALTLAGGRGRGIGVFLLALQESLERWSLAECLGGFDHDMEDLAEERTQLFNNKNYRPQARVTFPYLSFWDNDVLGFKSAEIGDFAATGWERLLAMEPTYSLMMTRNKNIPLFLARKLAKHPHHLVRLELAAKGSHYDEIWQILSRDPDDSVRNALAGLASNNGKFKYIYRLSDDSNEAVRNSAVHAYNLPIEVAQKIAKRGSVRQKTALARFTPDPRIQEILSRDTDIEVRLAVTSSRHLSVAAYDILKRDSSVQIQEALEKNYIHEIMRKLQVISADAAGFEL